jgi:hypothetical protein
VIALPVKLVRPTYAARTKPSALTTFDIANVGFAVAALGFWVCLYWLGW